MVPAFVAAPLALVRGSSAVAAVGGRRAVRARRGRAAVRACAPARASATGLEGAWTGFAKRMRETDASPPVAEWNDLLRVARDAGDAPAAAIWALDRMQESGQRPTAATYEILLEICLARDDRAAAFLLVEKMWQDKILLGDVSLPKDMEKTLRAILPPEAFD